MIVCVCVRLIRWLTRCGKMFMVSYFANKKLWRGQLTFRPEYCDEGGLYVFILLLCRTMLRSWCSGPRPWRSSTRSWTWSRFCSHYDTHVNVTLTVLHSWQHRGKVVSVVYMSVFTVMGKCQIKSRMPKSQNFIKSWPSSPNP